MQLVHVVLLCQGALVGWMVGHLLGVFFPIFGSRSVVEAVVTDVSIVAGAVNVKFGIAGSPKGVGIFTSSLCQDCRSETLPYDHSHVNVPHDQRGRCIDPGIAA